MSGKAIRTIGITTGGGDCPGLNAVIRAAVKAAILKHGWQVMGVQDGFDGLIFPDKCQPLTLKHVSGILPRGGTILGTTNRGDPFRYKYVEDGKETVCDVSDRLIANARNIGIDALIVIGGDGTQKIALELQRKGMNVVGVPKTIDNDISATEITFGFDTALHTATDAIDEIHTTAESHHRIMLVEVMGRDAGWIALEAGIAGGAHVILIPEIPFTIERIWQFVLARFEVLLRERAQPDSVQAALHTGATDLVSLEKRVSALQTVREKSRAQFEATAAAFKRIGNILAQAQQKGIAFVGFHAALCKSGSEQALSAALEQSRARVSGALAEKEDYLAAYAALAELRPVVDRFFDDVMVMVDDEAVRRNRMSLLRKVGSAVGRIADVTKIVVARRDYRAS